jgi:quercetin dioxygenase-like cupin family protein
MNTMMGVKWTGALAIVISGGALAAVLAQEEPAGFSQALPGTIKWTAHPVVSGAQIAILVGDPTKAGPFVMRVRLPPNTRVPPHTHPDTRTYTVLVGELKLGLGEKYDPATLRTFPAGGFYRLPAKVPHSQASGPSEAIVQIESVGPTSTDFVNPLDDPRKR